MLVAICFKKTITGVFSLSLNRNTDICSQFNFDLYTIFHFLVCNASLTLSAASEEGLVGPKYIKLTLGLKYKLAYSCGFVSSLFLWNMF